MASRTADGYENGRLRREAILDAAFGYFARAGYHGASLREIALAAGVSYPGLRHHFATKDALLLAVLAQREERAAALLERDDALPVLDRLVALLEANRAERGLAQLFARVAAEASEPDHPAHGYFLERYARIRSHLARGLRADAAAGRIGAGVDPERAAVALIALADGLQTQWLLDADAVDMAAELRRSATGILRG